jgi:hypothetical protein
MGKTRNTKRNVDLVSSHSDNEDEEGPFLLCSEEPTAVSDLYHNTERRLGVRPDERVIEYYEYIPDVDHNEY